jgi:hypothetical protein
MQIDSEAVNMLVKCLYGLSEILLIHKLRYLLHSR